MHVMAVYKMVVSCDYSSVWTHWLYHTLHSANVRTFALVVVRAGNCVVLLFLSLGTTIT